MFVKGANFDKYEGRIRFQRFLHQLTAPAAG